LQSRHSLELYLQSILLWLFWRQWLTNYLPKLASNCNPPDLSLPNRCFYILKKIFEAHYIERLIQFCHLQHAKNFKLVWHLRLGNWPIFRWHKVDKPMFNVILPAWNKFKVIY
jgi:hypothetical protein